LKVLLVVVTHLFKVLHTLRVVVVDQLRQVLTQRVHQLLVMVALVRQILFLEHL
jgi:hypothetical protein